MGQKCFNQEAMVQGLWEAANNWRPIFSATPSSLYVLCYVSHYSGLFVGKEGPMIHSGAIIGAGVPQVVN